jgi:hypothetical protein
MVSSHWVFDVMYPERSRLPGLFFSVSVAFSALKSTAVNDYFRYQRAELNN